MFLKSARIKKELIEDYCEYPLSIPFVRYLDELDLDAPIPLKIAEDW